MTCFGIMFPQSHNKLATYTSAHANEGCLIRNSAKKLIASKMHEPDFPTSGPSPVMSGRKDPRTPTPNSTTSNRTTTTPKGGGGGAAGSGGEQPATDAHYISANCVLFTYYSGDISAIVDEHFSRALSQPTIYGDKQSINK
uniref:Transcription cofactor vestigial-like protein 2 n=1 Tax=Strigamia maritima TaxID=126957 RepID=T1JLV0_STRMM